jgi:hypothetical protein
MRTTVLVEGRPGPVLERPDLRIVTAAPDDAGPVAAREVAAGASRIEIASGLGLFAYAEVLAELAGQDVEVGAVTFGGEVLEAAAAYRRRAAAGDAPAGAVLYLGATLDPFADSVFRDGRWFAPVPDDQSAGVVAARFADQGAGLVELCAGLGPAAAANVVLALGPDVAVGLALYQRRP